MGGQECRAEQADGRPVRGPRARAVKITILYKHAILYIPVSAQYLARRVRTSTYRGQFGGGRCDKNVNLMPTDSLSTQISDLYTNYYLFLRLIKSTKAVTRCCSLHLWLRTGEYSIKMTVGTLHIDLQHEITPLSMLISHLPPV